MTTENQANLRKSLRRSVERLAKLMDLNAPAPILANEIALLFSKGLLLYPEDVGRSFARLHRSQIALWGVCPDCGQDMPMDRPRFCCPACDTADDELADKLDRDYPEGDET